MQKNDRPIAQMGSRACDRPSPANVPDQRKYIGSGEDLDLDMLERDANAEQQYRNFMCGYDETVIGYEAASVGG